MPASTPNSSCAPFPAAALASPVDSHPGGWQSQPFADCIPPLVALFVLQRELLRTEAMWLVGVPYWDAKQAIGRHVLEDAQHAEAMLKRLHELKAVSAEHKQVAGVEELLHDLAGAEHGDEWLRALYTLIKPWLIDLMEDYLRTSDPVMDEPTQRVLKAAIAEHRRHIVWFADYQPRFSPWERADTSVWCDYTQALLRDTKLTNGTLDLPTSKPTRPDYAPFEVFATVRRDATFRVMPQSNLPREGATFAEKRFLAFYNHTQEMLFAESLCAVLYETANMPWAFHYDLARHIADEVRHATMGQMRIENLGVQLTEVPMFTRNYEFRSHLDPLERFCLMTLVMEASSFDRKRSNVAMFEQAGDRVSALYESYDVRDEMLHTNLGHVWVPILLRVYHDSRSVTELTAHCRDLLAQGFSEHPTPMPSGR